MVPGIVGIVCAAASWPVFAWPYFKASVPENGLHKAAFLVMVCGLVLLVGSFLPVPQMLAACITCGGGGAGPSGFFAVSGGVTAPCGLGQTYSGGPHAYDVHVLPFGGGTALGEREPRA